ncbi:serine hydrolase [Rhodococcoides kroppenstedtii]|uniref:serine hydrolase n=1 Tax=Rhodococcoides kroppenstedtii TaxID=293050 RepID=UPI0028E7A8B7|nr:serine hydrolase [Rhodococcus kroppenstedtii]
MRLALSRNGAHRTIVAVVVALGLTACGSVDPLLESGAARGAAATTSAESEPAERPAAAVTPVADTLLGWITTTDPLSIDPAAVDALATPELTGELAPIGGLLGPIAQIQQSAPITVTDRVDEGPESTVTLRTGRGTAVTLRLAAEGGRLAGIQALPDSPDVGTFDDVDAALLALGARTSFTVSRVDAGRCTTVHDLNSGETLPLASVAKLYVLGAVARAIDAGTLTWDEPLTVTDARKSAPSGQLQLAPEGTVVTVREAADAMIAISDNTATDLLIDRVGRAAVEAEVAATGSSDVAALTPFLTTREFFLLGWGRPDGRAQWRDASTAERRQILAGIADRTIDSNPVDPATADLDYVGIATRPATGDGIGWYASGSDLCAALASLSVGPQNDVVRQILAQNPGGQFDPTRWTYAGYKNGNAPGEVAGAWLLTDTAGQDWVISTQLASDTPIGPLDNAYAFELVTRSSAFL